jgi:hypothetical protein
LATVAAWCLCPGEALAALPVGYLDSAGCDGIVGWSQDPDEPAVGISVHIYLGGPAGTPGVPAAAITANLYREDLCTAIGSCEHGFLLGPPLSLLDGQARPIHAYGINTGEGGNPELGSSPRVLQCTPTASGVRRRVDGPGAFDSWKFNSYWDLLPLPEAEAEAMAMGPDIPDTPKLVQADGATEVWLVDGGARRLVSAAAAAAWRFDLAAVELVNATAITDLAEGTPWRPRPVLLTAGGLFVVDDEQAQAQTSSSSGAGSGGAGGSGSGEAASAGGSGNTSAGGGDGQGGGATPAAPEGDAGGCGIGALGDGAPGSGLAAAAVACLLAWAARRRLGATGAARRPAPRAARRLRD